jgi:hypothetical protein
MRTYIATGILAALISTANAAVITRGPYLQTPSGTSMVVRWRTDTATSSRVVIGPSPGSLTQTTDDATPATEHVVSLAGLTPDTQYYYSVGSVLGAFVGDDADHYFRTSPPIGTAKPVRLWAIGDAGFVGGAFAGNIESVRDAFKTFNGGSSHTDMFLLLGDNAYLSGTDAQYQAAVFDTHHDMLLTTPVWSTIGNHERLTSFPLSQSGPYFDMFTFPKNAEAGGLASGTEAYYSYDYGNVHVVVLDSEDHSGDPYLTTMTTWLTADLQATNADWLIAIWHRPPYSKGLLHDSDVEGPEISMRQFVVPILEQYGVDLVLCGHSHSYERSYFIDGHYGLSTTYDASVNQLDPGNGDPAGDGAYHKATFGLPSHAGAVYVVNGSGSEVRLPIGDHPAMFAKIGELGSLVVDIDGDTMTARFLNNGGVVSDQFRLIKGTACPATPATGCVAAPKAKVTLKTSQLPNKNRWSWRWKGGTVEAADVGTPTDQTDLAVCLYDATGALAGGQILHGAPEWSSLTDGLLYKNSAGARHGLQRIRIKFGSGTFAQVQAKAKGANVGNPATPVTGPLTAQLVNLDNGKCWASVFPTFRTNVTGKVTAALP